MSFEHLFNRWMGSGKPVETNNIKRSGKAYTTGWLPEEERTTKQWEHVMAARAKAKAEEEARVQEIKEYHRTKRDLNNDINYSKTTI